jgi:twitching motility protein PilT
MFAEYNDYVLSSSRQLGWITEEQESSTRFALDSIPGSAALDYLEEQQILSSAQCDQFRKIIQDAIQSSPSAQAETSSDPIEAASPIVTTPLQTVSTTTGAHVNDYLQYGLEHGASDILLSPYSKPCMRHAGGLRFIDDFPTLSPAETEELARGFLTADQLQTIHDIGSIEFSYNVPSMTRFRTSVVRQRRGWELVFRIINSKVRTMDEIGLPESLKVLTKYHNGLVLVTGAVGSGKSTTLAAMVEEINRERSDHIITLEDPIEYVFHPKKCQISQREVGTHTKSFASSLRASLREDPDVIMVGEMRDLETISLAITASETGHLVLGTLHTSTAARTLDRLLDVFPIEQQAQIRTMVSESIRGIVCQQLVPRADGQGRALAMEVMFNNPAVGNLIREAKTFMLPGVMQTGRKQGMRLMDDSLKQLLDDGIITIDEAMNRCENKKSFVQ